MVLLRGVPRRYAPGRLPSTRKRRGRRKSTGGGCCVGLRDAGGQHHAGGRSRGRTSMTRAGYERRRTLRPSPAAPPTTSIIVFQNLVASRAGSRFRREEVQNHRRAHSRSSRIGNHRRRRLHGWLVAGEVRDGERQDASRLLQPLDELHSGVACARRHHRALQRARDALRLLHHRDERLVEGGDAQDGVVGEVRRPVFEPTVDVNARLARRELSRRVRLQAVAASRVREQAPQLSFRRRSTRSTTRHPEPPVDGPQRRRFWNTGSSGNRRPSQKTSSAYVFGGADAGPLSS